MNNYTSGFPSLSADFLQSEQSTSSIKNYEIADDDQTGLCSRVLSVNYTKLTR